MAILPDDGRPMSDIPSATSVESIENVRNRRRSLPEVVDDNSAALWYALLALVLLPLYVTIRFRSYENARGLFWMYGGTIGVFWAVRQIFRRVLSWKDSVSSFLPDADTAPQDIEEYARAPWDRKLGYVLFCCGFTVVAEGVFIYGGLFANLKVIGSAVAFLFVALASYACALGLCAIFRLVVLVRQLGRYSVVVSDHPFGVMSVGGILVQAYLYAAVVWCLYTAMATVCRGDGMVPALVLALPAVAFFIGGFLAAQTPLHERMVEYKMQEIRRIDRKLLALHTSPDLPQSDDLRKQMEFLDKRLTSVLALPEWPFRWPSLLAVIGSSSASIVAPLMKTLLGEMWKLLPHN